MGSIYSYSFHNWNVAPSHIIISWCTQENLDAKCKGRAVVLIGLMHTNINSIVRAINLVVEVSLNFQFHVSNLLLTLR